MAFRVVLPVWPPLDDIVLILIDSDLQLNYLYYYVTPFYIIRENMFYIKLGRIGTPEALKAVEEYQSRQ